MIFFICVICLIEINANNADSDHLLHSATPDLHLFYLPMTLKLISSHQRARQ